jgi:hypothetical protein
VDVHLSNLRLKTPLVSTLAASPWMFTFLGVAIRQSPRGDLMLMVFAGTGERQPVTASNSGIASRQNNFLVIPEYGLDSLKCQGKVRRVKNMKTLTLLALAGLLCGCEGWCDHKWGKWSTPTRDRLMSQSRACTVCNMVEERTCYW